MAEPLQILWEDPDCVVVNKPSGVLSIPDGYEQGTANLREILTAQYGKIFVVHRLDQGTSGAIIFAKNEEAHRSLSLQFEQHTTEKIYHALCEGKPKKLEGMIELPLEEHPGKRGVMRVASSGGKESLTHIEVIEQFQKYCLIEGCPRTGRMHQIRVHLSAIGSPVSVDSTYGSGKPILLSDLKSGFKPKSGEGEKALLSRLGLHAYSLSFRHPRGREEMEVVAPYERDFEVTLKQLRRYGG